VPTVEHLDDDCKAPFLESPTDSHVQRPSLTPWCSGPEINPVAIETDLAVTVEALTVLDHVKFHIRHRGWGTPESVVEKPQLALRCEVTVTDHGANSSRATHQRRSV
jgi:hypothetical protein